MINHTQNSIQTTLDFTKSGAFLAAYLAGVPNGGALSTSPLWGGRTEGAGGGIFEICKKNPNGGALISPLGVPASGLPLKGGAENLVPASGLPLKGGAENLVPASGLPLKGGAEKLGEMSAKPTEGGGALYATESQ